MSAINMDQSLTSLLVNIPFAGLFWYALKRMEKKDEVIEKMADRSLQVIENNTKALTEMVGTVKEQVDMARQGQQRQSLLDERIYDVLTNRNGHANNI